MAWSPSNAGQIAYDRLLKRLEGFHPLNETASEFKELGQYLLEVNPSDRSHNRASIAKDLSAMLLSQNTVFTRHNFDRGGYAIQLLREVAKFFDVYELNARLVDLVNVSLRGNTTLMAYIRLAAINDDNLSIGKLMLAFRESRDARPVFQPRANLNSTLVTGRRITATA